LGDDEASFEFRPKIASLQNFITLGYEYEYEYETAFSWSTATSSWWMAFFERPLSRRKRRTLLCSVWSIPTIWNTFILLTVFPTFSFKDLVFEFLSLTVKVWLLKWYPMLPSWISHRHLLSELTSPPFQMRILVRRSNVLG
jgi:predicted Co/Zn/Cd cation transporter (cation efflux family)